MKADLSIDEIREVRRRNVAANAASWRPSVGRGDLMPLETSPDPATELYKLR